MEFKVRRLFYILFAACFIAFGFLGCGEEDGGPTGPALSAPQNVTAEAESDEEITVTWETTSVVAGFRIERTESGQGAWTQIAETNESAREYADTGLDEATSFDYRIKSFSGVAVSPNSSVVSATTMLKQPSDLSATDVSSSEIELSWTDNSGAEEGYEAQRSLTRDNFTSIAELEADASSYNDTGLEANNTYYYRVRAIMGEVVSEWSQIRNATTVAAPINLTAAPASHESMQLNWEDPNPLDNGFTVQRTRGDSENWNTIVNALMETSYLDNDQLTEGTLFRYRVKSTSNNLQSPYSAIASGVTLPKAPSRLEAAPGDEGGIGLTWRDNSNAEDGYEVYRSLTMDDGYEEAAVLETGTRAYVDFEITGNTTYYYKVRATKEGQGSLWSNTVEATTAEAPLNLTANPISDMNVELSWTDNSESETGFQLQRAVHEEVNYRTIMLLGENVTEYTDHHLTEGTLYYYRIRSETEAAYSPFSETASAVTLPRAPSEITAERASDTSIRISWLDNSAVEDGFEIQRSMNENDGYQIVGQAAADSMTYLDEGLQPNTTYYFMVRATMEDQASEWSDAASATTIVLTPEPPSGFTAEVRGPYEVYCEWTDNSDDENGFRVFKSPDGENDWTIGASIRMPNTTEAYVRGLNPETTYFLRVRAYNAHGLSASSNIVEVTTEPGPPSAPTNLRGDAPNHHYAQLQWDDNSDNELGFILQRLEQANPAWLPLDTLDAGATMYRDNDVEPRLVYQYRVGAFNDLGNSEWSNTLRINVPDAPIYAPTDLQADPVDMSRIELRWTDRSRNEEGFRIEQRLVGDEDFIESGETPPQENSFVVENLERGTAYEFRVKAFGTVGGSPVESDYSNIAEAATFAAISNPANLTADGIGLTEILVRVGEPPPFYDGIRVERRLLNQGDFEQIAEIAVDTLVDSGLEPETSYEYRVKAFTIYEGEEEESEYSNIAEGATFGPLVLYDDFEDYEEDQPPDNEDYTIDGEGDSWIRATADAAHESDLGLHFHDVADDGAFCRIVATCQPVSDGSVSFWMRIEEEDYFGIIGGDSENIITFRVQVNGDGTYFVQNGGNLTDGQGEIPRGEWFMFEALFNMEDGTWTLLVNDEPIDQDLATPQNLPMNQLIMLGFSNAEPACRAEVYIDDLDISRVMPEERGWNVNPPGRPFNRSQCNIYNTNAVGPVR